MIAAPEGGALRVAYVVNQYPLLSHSFIRREIRALEAQGVRVLRISIRPPAAALANAADREELALTRSVLGAGAFALAAAALRALFGRPRAALAALTLALRVGRRGRRGMLRHAAYWAEACVVREWAEAFGAERVHAHFGTNPAMVARLCRRLGGPPYGFTVHGPEEFDDPIGLDLAGKVHDADLAVAISDHGRAQLARWCAPADVAKLAVVRCGVDAALLETPPAPIPPGVRLLCVGRLCEAKGHAFLLEAAARLAAEGVPLDVAIVGDGPLRAELEARIVALGLAGRVQLLGALPEPDVLEQMRRARAIVLPSLAEGLPVVLMEALALGRPVVTTWIAGIPELVVPGISGWLVPAGNAERLAFAMSEAIRASDAELAEKGRAGGRRVAARHDVRHEAETLAKLFADASAGAR